MAPAVLRNASPAPISGGARVDGFSCAEAEVFCSATADREGAFIRAYASNKRSGLGPWTSWTCWAVAGGRTFHEGAECY